MNQIFNLDGFGTKKKVTENLFHITYFNLPPLVHQTLSFEVRPTSALKILRRVSLFLLNPPKTREE